MALKQQVLRRSSKASPKGLVSAKKNTAYIKGSSSSSSTKSSSTRSTLISSSNITKSGSTSSGSSKNTSISLWASSGAKGGYGASSSSASSGAASVSSGDTSPIIREYKVTKGKDGQNDWESEYPGMTFYTNVQYNLTQLQIPITKFENCSGIKFYIYRRQATNNQTNTVWLEQLIYTSKTFSLENARTSGKYQYMDDGFTIEFENGGLSLPAAQYVIIALPIPISGTGSCWVETYKSGDNKDFCIRYYGAANASHFLLKERYYETWYNSAKANGTTTEYEKEGSFISGTVEFDENTPPIKTVQTLIGEDNIPKGCSIEIYGDSGSGFQKLNTDSSNIDSDDGNITIMKGSRTSFKWKAILKGDGQNTPTLKYDKDKKYAIQFIFTHESPSVGNTTQALNYDKNMCITSKPFDGDDILRQYIGDMNIDTSKFSNYEFARVWADKKRNQNLIIDISGSDKTETVKDKNNVSHAFSPYSLHYCDLTLDDFTNTSVDYSNYDANVEIDENNMRLKIDTEHSYNDNDIQLFDISKFEQVEDPDENITFSEDGYCKIPQNYAPGTNKLLYKLKLDNPIDLTQYTGIKVALDVKKNNNASELTGLGIYISSQHEVDVPSNMINEPEGILKETGKLIDIISQQNTSYESLVAKYKDKIIKDIHEEVSANNIKTYEDVYYQYIASYDNKTNSLIYKLTQLHDIRNYYIYEMGKIIADDNKTVYQEIEIDQNSTNLKYVKEIGIILLGDEKDINDNDRLTVSNDIQFKLNEFKSIEHDYYPVFNPGNNHRMTLFEPDFENNDAAPYTTHEHGAISITNTTYGTLGVASVPKTFQTPVVQIHIKPSQINSSGVPICYFENKFATKNYRHIGIQIASDVYIPKYALQLNLCSDTEGKEVIESVNLPTLNYIWTPNASGYINLSQVFKKIETLETVVKSMSITTTSKFKNYMQNILGNGDNAKPGINIFIGKIVLYKAETIPMFHKKMRFKFYNDKDSGYSDTSDIVIRKIGTIADYS